MMSGKAGKLRVAVVFGGRSAEHAISCVSAGSVIAALDPERYDVVRVGITCAGEWVLTDPAQPLTIDGRELPEVTGGTPVMLSGSRLVVLDGAGKPDIEVDVVIPVLHGAFGEDGTVQGLLEMAALPYVGSGVLASAVGMDKEFAKKLLAADGLPVGDHVTLRPGMATLTGQQRDRLGLPVFVKPARAGSSIGITKVDDWATLDAAIATARHTDPKVLVEAAV